MDRFDAIVWLAASDVDGYHAQSNPSTRGVHPALVRLGALMDRVNSEREHDGVVAATPIMVSYATV